MTKKRMVVSVTEMGKSAEEREDLRISEEQEGTRDREAEAVEDSPQAKKQARKQVKTWRQKDCVREKQ